MADPVKTHNVINNKIDSKTGTSEDRCDISHPNILRSRFLKTNP